MPTNPRLAALLCVILWSMIAVVAKTGQSGLDFYQFLFLSNVISLLAVGAACLMAGRHVGRILRPGWRGIYLPGILGILDCLFYLALYRGYARSNGVIVLVAQYSWPLIIVLLSSLRDAQWPGRVKILGLAVGSFAFLIAVTKGHLTSLDISDPLSILIVLAGSFCFALMSTLSKNFVSDPFVGTFWLFFASMIGSLILMMSFSQLPHPADVRVIPVLANGVFINGVSYILWVLACARGDASETAALIFLSPILSAIWLVMFFGEVFVPAYGVALILVLISGYLCMLPPKRVGSPAKHPS